MTDKNGRNRLEQHLDRDIKRKLRKKNNRGNSLWFGMGLFGLVGWSVTIPALLCLALGVWLDSRVSSSYSWTLMLLVTGMVLGCLNAWYWVKKEQQAIEEDRGE